MEGYDQIATASREEWLQLRKGYIGGSDAGAVAGMNPYCGAYAVWLEKTGRAQGFEGNLRTEVGTYLEDFVAKEFERETGKKTRRVNKTLISSQYPWACADIDRRIVGENAILECKTTNSLPAMKMFGRNEYPEQWYCQMVHYLAVTGADMAYLAVLISGSQFRVFELRRDEKEIEALMRIEERFWQHVKDDTPPDAMAADAETVSQYLGSVQTQDETPLDLSPDVNLLQEYAEAKARADEWGKRLEELKARICVALGEYETGIAEGYRISWKPTSRSTFDLKSFQKSHPDMDLSPWYKESTSRRFVFQAAKAAE